MARRLYKRSPSLGGQPRGECCQPAERITLGNPDAVVERIAAKGDDYVRIYGHFRPRRHLMTAEQYRRARAKALRIWRQETCVQVAA